MLLVRGAVDQYGKMEDRVFSASLHKKIEGLRYYRLPNQ
jgi:hypothetical protein